MADFSCCYIYNGHQWCYIGNNEPCISWNTCLTALQSAPHTALTSITHLNTHSHLGTISCSFCVSFFLTSSQHSSSLSNVNLWCVSAKLDNVKQLVILDTHQGHHKMFLSSYVSFTFNPLCLCLSLSLQRRALLAHSTVPWPKRWRG